MTRAKRSSISQLVAGRTLFAPSGADRVHRALHAVKHAFLAAAHALALGDRQLARVLLPLLQKLGLLRDGQIGIVEDVLRCLEALGGVLKRRFEVAGCFPANVFLPGFLRERWAAGVTAARRDSPTPRPGQGSLGSGPNRSLGS